MTNIKVVNLIKLIEYITLASTLYTFVTCTCVRDYVTLRSSI